MRLINQMNLSGVDLNIVNIVKSIIVEYESSSEYDFSLLTEDHLRQLFGFNIWEITSDDFNDNEDEEQSLKDVVESILYWEIADIVDI